MLYDPKEPVIFDHLPKQKWEKKTKQKEFFNSVFSYGKRRDSSLTYFTDFEVLYL